ncbi:MAG: hypothetical protein KBD21_04290 [Candidatus Pacebacteria bacterium]|nr:hypothetical protein [Candidatus Paceibacterota bacterium]
MEQLCKLFGSPARVKLLRLFLFNPTKAYGRDDVIALSRITPPTATKELAWLARSGIIKHRNSTKSRENAERGTKRKAVVWVLDTGYPHLVQLSTFMRDTLSLSDADLIKRFRAVGSLRKLVFAGFLAGVIRESTLDALLVGERIDMPALEGVIRSLEAESGKEMRYAVFSTEEYLYRLRVRDKLLRDIMDYPHRVLIDKMLV